SVRDRVLGGVAAAGLFRQEARHAGTARVRAAGVHAGGALLRTAYQLPVARAHVGHARLSRRAAVRLALLPPARAGHGRTRARRRAAAGRDGRARRTAAARPRRRRPAGAVELSSGRSARAAQKDSMTDAATKVDTPSPGAASPDAFRQAKALHDAGKFAEAEALLRDAI